MADLKSFLEKQQTKNYTLLVIGKKGSVDEKILKSLGNFKELSLQEAFNYQKKQGGCLKTKRDNLSFLNDL